MSSCRILTASLLLLFCVGRIAHSQLPELLAPAQEPPDDAVTRESTSDAIKSKRDDVARRLSTARQALQETDGTANAQSSEASSWEVDLLSQLELVFSQQKTATEQRDELQSTQELLSTKLDALRSADSGSRERLSFFELDRLRDELAAEQAAESTYATAVQAATDGLERAKQIAAGKERDRLRAKEAVPANGDDQKTSKAAIALRRAELESQLAAETVKLRTLQLEIETLNVALHKLRLELLTEQVERHASSARFSPDDLSAKLDEIAKEEADLREKIALADRSFTTLDSRWVDRKHQLDLSPGATDSLREEVEYLRLARHVRQQEITILSQRLERLGRMKTAYKRRFEVITGDPPQADLVAWEKEASQYLDQLAQEARLHAIRVDQLRQDQTTMEAKMQAAQNLPPETAKEISLQHEQLQKLSRIYDTGFVSIESSKWLHRKLLAELGSDVDSITTGERAARIWQGIVDIWSYPLMTVDDRPITPGKIVAGLILLLIGYVISRFISRLLRARVLPRVGMNESAAAAIQSLSFYVLVAMFTVFSLNLVNVPLTMFTVLGGALAIGVGFGSQNIVNNFISGLILLAERPIRHGDLIQLEELFGTVEHIGARSTRVRTGNNLEIIVPNSSFLENNVANWTLSDQRIRAEITVGVAYGSPTRDVARLLKRAADEHGLVMRNPEPFVWFIDFGDNALAFQLHFWVAVRTLSDRMRIESDVRHKIDSLFREAGIVIAFPQRDVHLDVPKALNVRMLPQEIDESSGIEAA